MSKEKFDDNCPGCRPVLITLQHNSPVPADDPAMVALMHFWNTVSTLEEREAFHKVTCLNDKTPELLSTVWSLTKRMEDAIKKAEAKHENTPEIRQ